MVTIRITIDPLRIRRYLKENLGAPFVIFFQILLFVCAYLLIQRNLALANEVAVYAYYSLLIGVVLQLVSFLRHRKDGREDGGE